VTSRGRRAPPARVRGTGTPSLEERARANVLMNPPPPSPVQGDVQVESNASGAIQGGAPPPGVERIFREIEASADYYDPQTYEELLTYYNDLDLRQDAGLSLQFVGISAASANSKMFVVGILPPVSNVTGALLDRSGTAAALEETLPVRAYDQGGPKLVLIDGKLVPDPSDDESADAEPRKKDVERWGDHAKTLPDYFWIEWVTMCERLGADPVELAAVCYNESGFNPAAEHPPPTVAKGLFQFMHSIAVGTEARPGHMTEEEWETFGDLSASEQLPYFEEFLAKGKGKFRGKEGGGEDAQRVRIYSHVFGGYPNENLYQEWYISTEEQEIRVAELQRNLIEFRTRAAAQTDPKIKDAWLAEAARAEDKLKKPYPTETAKAYTNNAGYELNDNFDSDGSGAITAGDIARTIENKPPGWMQKKIREIEDSGQRSTYGQSAGNKLFPMWVDDGSEKAARMRKLLSEIARTGYNATKKGKALASAQAAQAIETTLRLENMRKTPPLRMLVNPASFSVKGEKIVSDGNWARNGPVIEHWGDAQDKISASGKIAGFYAMDRQNAREPGLNRTAKFFTKSFQNFLSLFLIYKNNGGLYLNESEGQYIRRNLSVVGSVYIYYDNTLYLGSFDNFNITEDATSPHTLEYSYDFTVRAAFLLDRPNEQGFTYGASGRFPTELAAGLPTTTAASEAAATDTYDEIEALAASELEGDEFKEKAAEVEARFIAGDPPGIGSIFSEGDLEDARRATDASLRERESRAVEDSPSAPEETRTDPTEVRIEYVLRQYERWKANAISTEQWDQVRAANADITKGVL